MSTTQNTYFGDSSSENDDIFDPASDASSLPFPRPLDRSSFLTSTFSAADFLSTLTTRFQTLEDLQAELQDLLRSLNKELVDLVNDNYTSFLSLGQKLSGGEERIEEVRVGLLGFQRDITSVRDLVSARSEDVTTLLEEKKRLRRDIRFGTSLLELEERLVGLERRLNVPPPGKDDRHDVSLSNKDETEDNEILGEFKEWSLDWSPDDIDLVLSEEDDEDFSGPSDLPKTVQKSFDQFMAVGQVLQTCGPQHPFVLAQKDRVDTIGTIIRRDLEAAIRAQSDVKTKQRIIQMRAKLEDHD